MNEENEQSRRYIEVRTQWQLRNVEELDEDTWVARATTTHLTKQGKSEQTFGVLARGSQHLTFSLNALDTLASWCSRQEVT